MSSSDTSATVLGLEQALHPAGIGEMPGGAEAVHRSEPADRLERHVEDVEHHGGDAEAHLPLLDVLMAEKRAQPRLRLGQLVRSELVGGVRHAPALPHFHIHHKAKRLPPGLLLKGVHFPGRHMDHRARPRRIEHAIHPLLTAAHEIDEDLVMLMRMLRPPRLGQVTVQPQTLDLDARHLQIEVLDEDGAVVFQCGSRLSVRELSPEHSVERVSNSC